MKLTESYKPKRNLQHQKIAACIACTLALGLAYPLNIAFADENEVEQHQQDTSQNHDEKVQSSSKDLNTFTLAGLTVEAKRPDWESKLSPGTITVIRPDDYKGEQKSLPELLKMVPGVHVREVNGKGQYTTVSVRGSTSAQVGVFVDGVLFNLGGDAAADISTIPVGNVERIEVYRGYIPARFGGTFMGGVVNIVTKRPTKADISASIGKSSYGGYQGNLEVDAPLGSGSIMFGINRDQSDGDFKYKNSFANKEKYELEKSNHELYINSTIRDTNDALEHLGMGDKKVSTIDEYNKLMSEQKDSIYDAAEKKKNDLAFYGDWEVYKSKDEFLNTTRTNQEYIYNKGTASNELQNYLDENGNKLSLDNYLVKMGVNNVQEALAKSNGYGTDITKYLQTFYGDTYASSLLESAESALKQAESQKNRMDAAANADRWRKTNDYKNTDAIVKWQDKNWLAKYTWKKIDRHYPFPINRNYADQAMIDYILDPIYNARHQEIMSNELLVGRRDTIGKLEWGWSINYLDQNKKYEVDNWQEKELKDPTVNWRQPTYYWSNYDITRWGGKLDGTYKIGDKHLFEFLVDTSKEEMDMDGWRLKKYQQASSSTARRYRNYYEQKIFNAQIQDTITLEKDLWLTPSIRYNRSNIYGLSSKYDQADDPQGIKFFNQADNQTDDKVTWQVAVKKQVNDKLTLRATGGTYFRLLNMYEIAGDGAGILPMPNVGGTGAVFPQPEEGSQWDLSAIWDGQILGTEISRIQLTYFGRDSKRMLQLGSWNNFFFVYTNAASAKVNGAEIQADMSWKKWDLNLQGTYTKPHDVEYDMTKLPGGSNSTEPWKFKGFLTYLPEWEGSIRLTYRPTNQWAIFTQSRYVDKMRTSLYEDGAGEIQSSLTVWDFGLKYKTKNDVQFIIGVNDMFDKGNDMYTKNTFFPDWAPETIQYPLPGRTYYVTVTCNF
ncbi:Vitamin B12 transporter BtuB precursor [Sporomusa ovata DSM 2662]|uniref:Outer membrane vitamin B12 receptor BtuB n=1 Tax=Sporomusa ovata TaxID=2378 RepID=A0A0U1L413_9FIRM|nr:TonB-dependent receptor [Sporomusa ovata]EQB25872.1 outer membrane cobalamin receptor protein [Sporomusa ovata DSM 2662]CQR74442.1 Outer membrane vitamin B12 receptor BtuB [Sporomusa ovata]